MLLPHGTVVALVDGDKFELFRNAGNESEPELVAALSPTLDVSNHSGASHHSVPGNHGDRQVAEDVHAIAATVWLNEQVLSHKLDDLVVIAAPRTLGEMRRHYHGQLKQKLLGELDKDLTGRQGPEIIAALRA